MSHQMAQLSQESWSSLNYSPSQAQREICAFYGSSTPGWADSVVLGQCQPVADVGLVQSWANSSVSWKMLLSRKIDPLATLLEIPKLNVSPLVWCDKGKLRLDGFCSHQRPLLEMRNSWGGHGCGKCLWVAPCLLPSIPAAGESHKSTLLLKRAAFGGKAELPPLPQLGKGRYLKTPRKRCIYVNIKK